MRPIIALALLLCLLASCSPAVRVARYYNRYGRSARKELRKPMHNLPLR